MPADKTERSCATCTKRHETGNPRAALECRALPPVQGVARDAAYPIVTPAHFCHLHYVEDPAAVKARKADAEATATLDGQVEGTQAAERERLAAAEALPEPAAPEAAAPKGRARRARPDASQTSLL